MITGNCGSICRASIEDVHARHVRKADVEDEGIGTAQPDQLQALLASLGREDGKRLGTEGFFDRVEDVGLIVHDQKARHGLYSGNKNLAAVFLPFALGKRGRG